jgi:hypothetical protein
LRKSSKLFDSIVEDEGEEMNQPREEDGEDDEEEEDEDGDTYHEISPLTYQSNMKGLEKIATPQRLSFQLETMTEEEVHDGEHDNGGGRGQGNEVIDDDDDDDSEDRYGTLIFSSFLLNWLIC